MSFILTEKSDVHTKHIDAVVADTHDNLTNG
jgi:hypothetical protein